MEPRSGDSKTTSSGSANQTFLFVNDSTSTAGRKIGRRSEIKSHVRNYVVQRGKESRKKDDQDTHLPAFSNDVDSTGYSKTSKKTAEESVPAGRNLKAQAAAPLRLRSQASPRHPVSTQGVSVSYTPRKSISPEAAIPPSASKINSFRKHAPKNRTQIPFTPLPKSRAISDALARAIALTSRNSLEPQGSYREYGHLQETLDFFKPTVTVGSNGSRLVTRYDALQSLHLANCVVCGPTCRILRHYDEYEDAWEMDVAGQMDYDGEGFKEAAYEAVKWQALRSRPLDQLGSLGNGRVDPFNCYPTIVDDPNGNMGELVDHAVTYLLPGLLAEGSSSTPSGVMTAWMSSGLKSPLLFHALVFASSIHLSYLRTSTINPNSAVSLTHKLAVIRQLNKVLRSPTERVRDEIILAILILSSHEAMDLDASEESGFDSPLRRMQWLNVYGNIKNIQEHLKAVMDLVTLRGGVESLELHGLAEILLCGDTVTATVTMSKPTFQPLKRSVQWLDEALHWARSPPRPQYLKLGSSFKQYNQHGITLEMIELFEAMSAVTLAIEHHLSGKPKGLNPAIIAKTRTVCQQKVLLLNPASEIAKSSGKKPSVYEAVRLAANIYAIGIIFPIPRPSPVLLTLAQKLAAAIEEAELERYGNPIPDVLLWMLILGGIAAGNKPERHWFVDHLAVLVRKWDFPDWTSVERVMGRFLWLDSACGFSGRSIWSLVVERLAYFDAN